MKTVSEAKNDYNMSVVSGDYFHLPMTKGYTKKASQVAMQVMECWESVMTVKCKNGCMTKNYSEFEKVTDISLYKEIYNAPYFEDNRVG